MPRESRIKSALGIYHVMLRGINKQNIFFCEDDFLRMMHILQEAPMEKDTATEEIISDSLCTIYAYCILDNHLHILIREGKQNISEIMKRIESRYAIYYNKKYERTGHLFQARFPSEPVNDSAYFFTLLRYIHRNPVKALEASTPEEYPYSSWNEYTGHPSNLIKVLKPSAIQATLEKFPLHVLTEWVNFPPSDAPADPAIPSYIALHAIADLSKIDQCLDMNNFTNVITDKDAMDILLEVSGYTNPEDFRLFDAPTQIFYLLQAIDHGVNIKQASRLGTITEYQLRKAVLKKTQSLVHTEKCGETSNSVPVPEFEKSVEKTDGHIEELQQRVRQMEGLSTKTYHKLHQIIEYLHIHPVARCQDIALHIDVSNESARRLLVRLANENIIAISGKSRSCTYSLN